MNPNVGHHLVDGIQQALEQANLTPSDITSISLNLSGEQEALTLSNARQWLTPLHLPKSSNLFVGEDGLSAWAAAGFPDPSIWVLLGTYWGSAGLHHGNIVEHPLDNVELGLDTACLAEGATIGSLALSRAIGSQFGGPRTTLYDALCAHLNSKDVSDLIQWARNHRAGNQRATLFQVAAEVATAGDPIAKQLFHQAGKGLGKVTAVMGHYMGFIETEVTIILAGNAWQAGDILLKPFRQTVQPELPKAIISLNRLTQAEGAALLAMKLSGIVPTTEVFEEVLRSREEHSFE